VVEALPCEVKADEHEYNRWKFRDLIVTGNPDCLNLLGSVTNYASVQEYSGSRLEMDLARLFQNSIIFENRFLRIPTEPSLGLTVDEKEMEKKKLNR